MLNINKKPGDLFTADEVNTIGAAIDGLSTQVEQCAKTTDVNTQLNETVKKTELSTTLSDYNTKSEVDNKINGFVTEYNVSKHHPTSGIGGTNKFTLAEAIKLIPADLQSVGIKCSFINESGVVENWVWQGGVITDIATWKEVGVGSSEIKRIDNELAIMKTEGNALTSDVSKGKKLIAEAITAKGVPTKESESFITMANNINMISRGVADELFAIEIDNNMPSPEVKRIGTPVFPNWLESETQNIMVKDGKIAYQLDRKTSYKKHNGLEAVVDGTDGDVMIRLPKFWYNRVITESGVERITFSPTPQLEAGWVESPEIWPGASEMVIEQSGSDLIARSCYNTSANFRGGINNAQWDILPKSLLGMPRTSLNHDSMRTACNNKGSFATGVYHNSDYRLYVKLNLMFMCIFGTRNWQADYAGIDPSTGEMKRNAEGFKYGGLGKGVTDCGTWWSSFNSWNPFVKTNVGYELGCRSGVIEHAINIGTPEQPNIKTVIVPVFLGVVNIYGHIYKAMDGITKEVIDEGGVPTEQWAIYNDPKKYISTGTIGAKKVIKMPATQGGWITKLNEDFLPIAFGGNESQSYCDYDYLTKNIGKHSVWSSLYADFGGFAGGFAVYAHYGVGYAHAFCGGRLCFSPV